jgi:hypothetical protein
MNENKKIRKQGQGRHVGVDTKSLSMGLPLTCPNFFIVMQKFCWVSENSGNIDSWILAQSQ